MAIKGLTDNVAPAFPRLGKLRKGDTKLDKGYGKDLTHFRFTSDRPEIEEAFTAAYGERAALLHVYLPYADIERNFSTWKEAWAAGGLQHRCDGETCTIWLGPDGKYHQEPKPCPGKCDEVGRLSVILPELWKAGFVGYVTMETHSVNDLMSIQATLLATLESRGDNPLGLRGIEFVLRRAPEKISVPGFGANAGKRQHVEKWLVKLEPAQDWVLLQLEAARGRPLALAAGDPSALSPRKMLTAARNAVVVLPDGQEVDTDTGEMLDGEMDEEPAPKAGWETWSESARKGFWAKCNELKLTEDQVHAEFGVKSMKDYTSPQPRVVTLLQIIQYGQSQGLTLGQIHQALKIERIEAWHDDLGIAQSWMDAHLVELKAQAQRATKTTAATPEQIPF